ncbi:MAG: rhomboid family intramembrane serine protease [Paramuribaculum sp.]|nr:rhomboid family intramembrane serine protease [Paramuribaculum sp.]
MGDIIKQICKNYGIWFLLGINMFAFCLLQLAKISVSFSNYIYDLFSLPASIDEMLLKPWTVLTYMFIHDDISHFVTNMVCLSVVGSLASLIVDSKRIISMYVIGGLTGALFFLFFYSVIPPSFSENNLLLGSSAALYAILVFITLKKSILEFKIKYLVYFPFRWLVGALLLLNLLGLTGENYAANFSHLGGAFGGVLFYIFHRLSGKDISNPSEENNSLEALMEKIKNSGYSSLSIEEKKSLLDKNK